MVSPAAVGGSSGCTRAKAWSVSSNIAPAPGLVRVQKPNAMTRTTINSKVRLQYQ
jgi:hypothetical protein